MIITQKLNENLDKSISKLDDSQLASITSDSKDVVIRAPAGSGKTTTLINAVAVCKTTFPDYRVCAITYTRAARAEMESRLASMGIRQAEITTIHVWAREMLKHFSNMYDFKIKILEEPDIKAILKEVADDYLKRSKLKSINIDILYTYITGTKKMNISENYRRTLNALEARYLSYKKKNHLYDFTDYPLYLKDVMDYYGATIDNIDALFVDEFQDVDETQLAIFKKTNTKLKFYIGDPWQSIFIFRGADGAVFNKLDNFELFKLKYNYRSYQEIIDYASSVYESLKEQVEYGEPCYIAECMTTNPSSIICNRGYGGRVTVVNPFGDGVQFYNGNNVKNFYNIKEELNRIIDKHPMILCRTNKQVNAIRAAGYENVDTIHQAKGLEYDDVVVIDTTIQEYEDLNIAYVALTRARNEMFVIN